MSKSIFRNQLITLLAHLSAWGIFFCMPLLLVSKRRQQHIAEIEDAPLAAMLVFGSLIVSLFYINFFLLIPRVLNRFGIRFYVISLIILYIIAMSLGFLINNLYFPSVELMDFSFVFPFSVVMAMSLSIRLLMDKTQLERQQKERENETLKSELSFLRSQISPHFLFNIMNNVVALSRIKPEKVEPTLIQLSQLMRYMLYSSDEKKVSIAKEIDYLENYIALQKLRFGDSVAVIFNKNVADTEGSLIEPMLLIPFVENAFKHGTGMVEAPRIDINFSFKDNKLIFNILNTFDPLSTDLKDADSGIGLKNVSRRLALLYGDNHRLDIADKNGIFQVDLTLNLTFPK